MIKPDRSVSFDLSLITCLASDDREYCDHDAIDDLDHYASGNAIV
jgi:hypothetical protein